MRLFALLAFGVLSIVLEQVEHFYLHSVDVDLFVVLINPLEEVFEAKKVGENFVAEIVHEIDLVTFADNDALLKAIEHLLVHVSLLVIQLGLLNLLFDDGVVDLKEFWDHYHQVDHCDGDGLCGMLGHVH